MSTRNRYVYAPPWNAKPSQWQQKTPEGYLKGVVISIGLSIFRMLTGFLAEALNITLDQPKSPDSYVSYIEQWETYGTPESLRA